LAPLSEVAPLARGGLLEVLESVPDPRKKRGVRHRFAVILFVSVCAVVSGARSFAAIAEWAADAVEDTLSGMGIGAPTASTIRRALSALSGDGFDTAIGGFLASRVAAARTKTTQAKAGARLRRRAIFIGPPCAELPQSLLYEIRDIVIANPAGKVSRNYFEVLVMLTEGRPWLPATN
jgi:hypothetical protein